MRASLHVTLSSPSPGAGPIHKRSVKNSDRIVARSHDVATQSADGLADLLPAYPSWHCEKKPKA